MRRPDVLIFVEHVARELDAACLFKHLLVRRYGLDAAIRSICFELEQTLREFRPVTAALPYCYSGRDFGVYDIVSAWPQTRYVNLAFEQIFLDIQRPFKAPRDRFAHEAVLHLAWGEESAAFFAQAGVRPDNIVVVGCPVMALYQEPYRRRFDSRELLAARHGLDPRAPWLLITEQHAAAIHQNAHLYAKGPITPEQTKQFQDFADASFAEAVRWWWAAAETGAAEVVVRPRPTVSPQRLTALMREACGDFPKRLHVIKDGSVREWILACETVASSYSTTLIEAAVAGKEICMTAPFDFPPLCRAAWFQATPAAVDLDGFLEAVLAGPGRGSWRRLGRWAADKLGLTGDPVSRVVDVLAAAARGGIGPGSPEAAGLALDKPTSFFTAPLQAHADDALTQAMVEERVERWARVVD